MKILQIHNKYRYFGGEDSVVDEEAKLLRSQNHEVNQLIRDNSEELISFQDKFITFKNISYSHKSVEILNKEFLIFFLHMGLSIFSFEILCMDESYW